MDGELKAILIIGALLIVTVFITNVVYPGGVMGLFGILGK